MSVDVIVALGGNIGDRMENLEKALQLLASHMFEMERSPIYESAPKYLVEQPMFLNMVVRGEVSVAAADLLRVMKGIERDLGRTAGVRNGPRPIDLDIIYYGDAVIETPSLTVPHPRLYERGFVLQPLADIDPDRRDPVSGARVIDMLAALPDDGGLARL
ncbi:MAG: 2-amino-4-hydroxy-6-hydroxymethyldihydropteridine diphosphokinase [Alphaproteobacteria bacterium]|jgi:2-amino-4-hydroxy-6-hydroxymethyldihydropteridine diphosphokinase